MTMAAPTAHAAPPPPAAGGAPPPAAPPAPGAATGAGPVAALQQAATKLQALIQAATANGGALPPTAATEVPAIIAALQGAVPAGGGAPAPAAPPAGAAPGGPPKPPPPGVGKAEGEVQKMELDEFTAIKVTLDAARERLWGVSDALREGDTDKAKTELKGVVSMLSGLKGDAMKSTEVKMDKALFASWTASQFEAIKADDEETAKARLACVKRVTAIAKASWEAQKEGTAPFTVEMEAAFAPLPEKTMGDLTATKDQSEKETPAAKDKVDGQGSFAQNLGEVIKDVQSALSLTEQPGPNAANMAFSNPPAPAKDPTAKSDTTKTEKADPNAPFVWPMDMNDPEPGLPFEEKAEPAKRPADADDGWGRDPWATK